jgi:hypothetical protein
MEKKVYNTTFQTIVVDYLKLGKELRNSSINYLMDVLKDTESNLIQLDIEDEDECISLPFYSNKFDSTELSLVSYVSLNNCGHIVVGSCSLDCECTLDDFSDLAVSDIAGAVCNHLEK